MPPIETDVLALDFDAAVITHVYRFEQREEVARGEYLARLTAAETARRVARLLLPAWGYELKEPGAVEGHTHAFVDGLCACGLSNRGGVLRYGDDAPECKRHKMKDGVCVKCGGRKVGGFVTKPSPRVIGRCEHPADRLTPQDGGGMHCTLCGTGNIY